MEIERVPEAGDLGRFVDVVVERHPPLLPIDTAPEAERLAQRGATLPLVHQLDRLKQISFQRNEKNQGISSVLLSKAIAEQLGIDDEQKDRLKKRAEELKKQFDDKVAALKADMRKELLQELTPEQREKIDEMTGDKYEFKDNGPGRFGFGPRNARTRVERRDDGGK